MNLIIDRGNTLVKWALFEHDTIRLKDKSKKLEDNTIEALFDLYPIENAILSAVSEVAFSEETIRRRCNYIRLDHHTPTSFDNHYSTPETLGRDRIAVVAGAMKEWPGRDLVIIDTGTCLTIDFVDSKGNYLGGNISPGPELRYMAMDTGTANLPLVSRPAHYSMIGDSTQTALENGGFGGCIAEIIGWIELAGERFLNPIVVLSGGDATAFATSIKNEIFVRPDLVLMGLNEILNFNVN